MGLIGSVAVFTTATSAFAGVKEVAAATSALAALPGAPTFANATGAQIAAAYTAAIGNTANAKLKPGIIAGEFLRLAQQDVGAALGAAITGDKPGIASLAAVTAAANTANIPKFALAVGVTPAGVTDIAALATKSKVAVSAILSGAAQVAVDDAARTAIFNGAIANKKLKSLFFEVSQGASASAVNASTFASAAAAAAGKSAIKAVAGVIAGNPTKGGEITDATKTIVGGTQAVAFAKIVGAGADIEQIQKIGAVLAGSLVKVSSVTALATALGKSIATKPNTVADAAANTSVTGGPNRNSNKVDELGELTAYMLNAIKANPDLADAKKGPKLVLGLITAIAKAAKVKVPKTGGLVALNLSEVVQYVTGSAALTLKSIGTAGTAALAALSGKNLDKLAGLAGKGILTGTALTAIVTAASTTGTPRFEDGTVALTPGLGTNVVGLTDPETNTRSF